MEINQSLPLIFVGSSAFNLIVGEEDDYRHSFGGLGIQLRTEQRREILRHVFTLDLSDPRLGFRRGADRLLPLYYNFESSGEISYEILTDNTLRILKLSDDEPQADWPYPGYPRDFPVSPIKLREVESSSLEAVIQSYAFLAGLHYNEGALDTSKNCYVIAMPRTEMGVSLWGEEGDAAMVSVGFTIDVHSHRIKAVQALG